MASLIRDPNGSFRVEFVGAAGRKRVRLGQVPVKAAEHWHRRIEALVADVTAGVAHSHELAQWLADLPDKAHERLVRAGLAAGREQRVVVTLGSLIDAFLDRQTVKQSTRKSYKQTMDSLRQFFGTDRPLATIDTGAADAWRRWIAEDNKAVGRKRESTTNRLAPATVAKRVFVARAIFRKAVRWGMVAQSPFHDVKAGSQANPAKAAYVGLQTTADVLEHCPSVDWRVVVALARYAGLRCPTEVGSVTWADVDWSRGRLTVRSKKTEHHGGEHAVRVVPICPELRVVLADAFDHAADGATLVAPLAARVGTNLRTTLEKIIARAGHTPWPRLFQNLRASCATDWTERYPAHVVAKWLGHSPTIAAVHYLQARDHHFADVVGGGQKSGAKGAKTGALEAQKQAQQQSADVRTTPHETSEAATTPGVIAVFAENTTNCTDVQVGDIGLEPMTPSLSSGGTVVLSAGNKALTASRADRCTSRCTENVEQRDELARVVALVAQLPGTDDERAGLLARAVELLGSLGK
jgi:integrase